MIPLKTHFVEATRQLLSSKLRAFLAVLGILVGTASVVAMVSIGKLAEEQILMQFEQLGINLLSIAIYPSSSSSADTPHSALSLADATHIEQASTNIINAAPYVSTYQPITYRGFPLQGDVVGVTPTMFELAQLRLLDGRLLSFLDQQDYFCVIGHGFYQTLQQHGIENPIGTQIRVGDTFFTIAGVLQAWPINWFFNTDFNHALLIPITTALSMQKGANISNIALRLKNTDLLSETTHQVTRYIQQHTLDQRITINSPKTIIDSMKASSNTMALLLGLIGSISLIVGGIGVMNIMLVSVTERRREIGIRLAIGARPQDIQWQFLIESVTLSVFGGVGGIVLGILVTYGVSHYSHWHFSFFILPPILGGVISILVGVFFGFYPARKAAQLDPIETLRSE